MPSNDLGCRPPRETPPLKKTTIVLARLVGGRPMNTFSHTDAISKRALSTVLYEQLRKEEHATVARLLARMVLSTSFFVDYYHLLASYSS